MGRYEWEEVPETYRQTARNLYRIAEDVLPEDVCAHPKTAMEPGQEWLTYRELRVELIRPTEIVVEELLSDDDIEELKQRGRH